VADPPAPGRRGAPLLPPVDALRMVSAAVGIAVARAAAAGGLAQVELDDPVQQVHEAMWRPEYPRVEAVWSACRPAARSCFAGSFSGTLRVRHRPDTNTQGEATCWWTRTPPRPGNGSRRSTRCSSSRAPT